MGADVTKSQGMLPYFFFSRALPTYVALLCRLHAAAQAKSVGYAPVTNQSAPACASSMRASSNSPIGDRPRERYFEADVPCVRPSEPSITYHSSEPSFRATGFAGNSVCGSMMSKK
ncbi:hypothetical protein F4810DRAFT_708058 [Camillea tinctor]|nr:hypothetical protein F4810DRAFT_708058 [Camillea tinctor]